MFDESEGIKFSKSFFKIKNTVVKNTKVAKIHPGFEPGFGRKVQRPTLSHRVHDYNGTKLPELRLTESLVSAGTKFLTY